MTTEEQVPAASEQSKDSVLIQLILKGEEEKAAKLAFEISREKNESNGVIDTISEAMNIATDLHEVEGYTRDQMEKSELAAERALEAVKGKIRVEQRKIHGRVMVASIEGDPHSFEKTLILTMFQACGFTPLDGGADLTPSLFIEAVRSNNPDVLAVPILTQKAAERLRETVQLMKSKRNVGLVVFGRGAKDLSSHVAFGIVEKDSLGAVSRVAELLIAKAD